MAMKTTGPGTGSRAKTAEQAQAQALSRYNAKKATEKSMAASATKAQADATARYNAKKAAASNQYKTTAKGELMIGGKKATYKGGKAPEKMKSANVSVTRTLPEVTVKASKGTTNKALTDYKKTKMTSGYKKK